MVDESRYKINWAKNSNPFEENREVELFSHEGAVKLYESGETEPICTIPVQSTKVANIEIRFGETTYDEDKLVEVVFIFDTTSETPVIGNTSGVIGNTSGVIGAVYYPQGLPGTTGVWSGDSGS